MSSPSEFLTFYRRFATHPALRQRIAGSPSVRTFTSSIARASSGGKLSTDSSVKSDKYPDSEHATDKKDKLDVQSESSSKGQEYVVLGSTPRTCDMESNEQLVEQSRQAKVAPPLPRAIRTTAPNAQRRTTPKLQMSSLVCRMKEEARAVDCHEPLPL